MLGVVKSTSFELFFLDDCEGVHENLLQRPKPRCLFEIGLRPSWGQRLITLDNQDGDVGVHTDWQQ